MTSLWDSVSLTETCPAKIVIGKHRIQSLHQLKPKFFLLFYDFDRQTLLGAGVMCAFSTALTRGTQNKHFFTLHTLAVEFCTKTVEVKL